VGSEAIAAKSPSGADIRLAEQTVAELIDGERKTVTALFADIKGSTELMEALDPEEARAIIDPALKLMIDAVRRYDGYVVQSTGDGIFALFGAPLAHEDHPQRALYSALRMQDELSRFSAHLVAEGGTPIQCRVGTNTGEVVVRSISTGEGQAEYTPIGHMTNLASRMQAAAPVGSIAVSDATRRWCEGYFAFRSLGPTRLRGVQDPVEVHEVIGLGPLRTRLQRAAGRGLTKFVGREREMEALKHAAELAQTGHGQIVAVVADPGVGKSRLFYEFKATSASAWSGLEAFSVSHGKASAYLPVIELLSEYFEISRDDDDRKRGERILGKVLRLDRKLEDTLPYLYSLLAIADAGDSLAQMDPQIRRRRTLDAIKRILLRESLNQPLMVIFEDLHWIDAETQALLNLLVDAIGNARILLLVNYRPEYRHEWGSRTHYTQLRLNPLGRESAEEMLSAMLGDDKDLDPLKLQIIERIQGTPFFMEEMVQTLFEEAILQRNGTVKLAKPINVIKVPSTMQAVLASRIDRLAAPEKELLQTAAVLGREFSLSLAQRVTHKAGDDLERILSQLQFAEFIYEQPAVGEVEYRFKHALTQEIAYNSILAERRRALHERAGRAIEELNAHQLEVQYSDLARHYVRGDNPAKAVEYAALAAEQQVNRGSYVEASGLIQDALKLMDRLPDEDRRLRAELRLRNVENVLGFVLHGGSSLERERVVRRMCELGDEIGEVDQLLRGLIILCNLYFVRGEAAPGLQVAKRCLRLAAGIQDASVIADAYYSAGILACSYGNLREALSHFKAASLHSRRTNTKVSLVGFLYSSSTDLAWLLQLLGRVSEAGKLSEEALAHARDSKHLFNLGHELTVGGIIRSYRREPETVLQYADQAITLSEENGFPLWLHWGQINRGWALAELRHPDQGIPEMATGIGGLAHMGGAPQLQFATARLAHTYARVGRIAEGLAMLNEALAHIAQTGEKVDKAEMLRLNGEVLLMRDVSETAEAEECFRSALEVARAQEAKWWELRSSVSLARLLRDTNRRDEARTLLGEIYNWFTEDFDLLDLKDAKALLEELSG
jgi:class 3 adenylate cyclase/tetratricopeptide (TPR) repeat protein